MSFNLSFARFSLFSAALAGFLALGALPLSGCADKNAPVAAVDDGKFELVDAAHRELDGLPALALSFSQPLDAKADVGKFVQVLEMPPLPGQAKARAQNDEEDADEFDGAADGRRNSGVSRAPEDTGLDNGKPVAGAWTVGDNPRLLFFPHIKPSARYVVRVQPGLPAKSGAKLAA